MWEAWISGPRGVQNVATTCLFHEVFRVSWTSNSASEKKRKTFKTSKAQRKLGFKERARYLLLNCFFSYNYTCWTKEYSPETEFHIAHPSSSKSTTKWFKRWEENANQWVGACARRTKYVTHNWNNTEQRWVLKYSTSSGIFSAMARLRLERADWLLWRRRNSFEIVKNNTWRAKHIVVIFYIIPL